LYHHVIFIIILFKKIIKKFTGCWLHARVPGELGLGWAALETIGPLIPWSVLTFHHPCGQKRGSATSGKNCMQPVPNSQVFL
jgi:hypothetical protein